MKAVRVGNRRRFHRNSAATIIAIVKEKARAEARAVAPLASRGSERQPALLLAELHIADIGAEPCADADAERDQVHIAAPHIGGVATAHTIGGAFAGGEPNETEKG